MIKDMLVCTDGSAYGNIACSYALDLSKRLNAVLTGLHVLDSRMLEGPLMADVSGWVGAQPYSEQLTQFRDVLQAKGEAVIAAFEDQAREAGVNVSTLLKMGHPTRVMLEEENSHELLVLGQRGEHAEWGGDLMGSTADRMVRHADSPCLVTPAEYRPIRRILAAYDGSGHAGKALHEAIELAQGLSVPLSILTVAEDKDMDAANAVSREGLRLAEAHGCEAGHLVGKGIAEDAILQMAQEHGFDLIVMGAFGHGLIREMFLGSTTAQLVARSTLPVLLAR